MPTPVVYHMESFVPVSNFGDVYLWYDIGPGDSSAGIATQIGRGVGADQAYALRGATLGYNLSRSGVAARSTIGSGMAINCSAVSGFTSIVAFGETDTTTHVSIGINGATGNIVAYRGALGSGALLGTSTYVFPILPAVAPLPQLHVESIVHIDDSTGTVDVKVEGISVLSLSGLDTKVNTGTLGLCNQIMLSGNGTGGNGCRSDWYVHDGSAFWGDKRLFYRPANAGGTYAGGVATGAGSLLACVNQLRLPTTEDTDYILYDTSVLPVASTFTHAALPISILSVDAVCPRVVARKDDAGTNIGKLVFISGGTEDAGADIPLLTGWQAYQRVYQLDPNGSIAWTIANANAVQAGFRRTS